MIEQLFESKEKKVEYIELIYDLIFVYIIGRNNALLETARKMQAAGADPAYIKEMTGIEL